MMTQIELEFKLKQLQDAYKFYYRCFLDHSDQCMPTNNMNIIIKQMEIITETLCINMVDIDKLETEVKINY